MSTNATSKQREAEPTQQNLKENSASMPVSPKLSRKEKLLKDLDKDNNAKDEYGITRKLRVAINKKYEVIEVIGNGSYGCVS